MKGFYKSCVYGANFRKMIFGNVIFGTFDVFMQNMKPLEIKVDGENRKELITKPNLSADAHMVMDLNTTCLLFLDFLIYP